MTERLECNDFDQDTMAGHWKSCEDHVGWKHAESWEEASAALSAGDIYDYCGDRITVLFPQSGGYCRITYVLPGGTDSYSAETPHYVLVPEIPPVTQEELAEVYRSLGVPMWVDSEVDIDNDA